MCLRHWILPVSDTTGRLPPVSILSLRHYIMCNTWLYHLPSIKGFLFISHMSNKRRQGRSFQTGILGKPKISFLPSPTYLTFLMFLLIIIHISPTFNYCVTVACFESYLLCSLLSLFFLSNSVKHWSGHRSCSLVVAMISYIFHWGRVQWFWHGYKSLRGFNLGLRIWRTIWNSIYLRALSSQTLHSQQSIILMNLSESHPALKNLFFKW